MPETENDNGKINHSVVKAFQLLEAFGHEKTEWGVSELARLVGLNKSTVYRLLNTLEEVGAVSQNAENNRYSLGIKLFELGHRTPVRSVISQSVHPILETVAESIQETVQFVVPHEANALVIDQVISPYGLRLAPTLPCKIPYGKTAAGRALLHGKATDDLIHKSPLAVALMEDELTRALNAIEEGNQLGYYLEREEHEVGLVSLALPVHSNTYQVAGAISVSGPSSRFRESALSEYVSIIKKGVKALENELNRLQIPSLNPYIDYE